MKTDIDLEKLEEEAITWEDNFYACYGYMPSYEETPEKYKKVLWTPY